MNCWNIFFNCVIFAMLQFYSFFFSLNFLPSLYSVWRSWKHQGGVMKINRNFHLRIVSSYCKSPKCHKIKVCSLQLSVLVSLGCDNKNTIDWVTYKQQEFISLCFEDWEVQNQGTSRFGVSWKLASWLIGVVFSL